MQQTITKRIQEQLRWSEEDNPLVTEQETEISPYRLIV